MTTPVKQYQNVSFKDLLSYAENNPNRSRTLESIEILPVKTTQDTSLDKLGLKGYSAATLNPSGILSLLVCISDPTYYSLSSKNIRIQSIIELATKLQEETEQLKNTALSRKRRKVHDLIGAVYNGATLEEKDYLDLYCGISFMRNINFVLMKETIQDSIEGGGSGVENGLKGEIVFASDPRNWKRDDPVWIADYRCRWVAIPSDTTAPTHTILGNWLSTMEQTGWIIQWPEAEGTKAEIVEMMSTLPIWQETDKKLSKDVLAARLGRADTIKVFSRWLLSTSDISS